MSSRFNSSLCLAALLFCRTTAPAQPTNLYTGARCHSAVPDTLDLADRATLAINGLTRTCDPERDCFQYWWVNLNCRRPHLVHWGAQFTCTPKFAEALPFMRVMSGSDQNLDVDETMLNSLVGSLSADDGLYYVVYSPKRPWHLNTHLGNNYGAKYDVKPEDIANVGAQGIMMRAMLVRRQVDPNPIWDERIRAMVRGLDKIAIHKEDYAYYPDGGFGEAFSYPKSGWLRSDEPKGEHEGGEGTVIGYHGKQIHALALWAKVSGDQKALDLARQLTAFVMKPKFWGGLSPNPIIRGDEKGQVDSHLHARMIAVRGLLEYGIVAHDIRVCDFARSSYEYMRSMGIPEIGWIPSLVGNRGRDMEGCFLGDEIALAIKLSDAGLGDYWDDVDRIARNALVEQQYTRRDVLQRIVEHSPDREPSALLPGQAAVLPGQVSFDNVIERAMGIYAALATPASVESAWTMQCCTANGIQGLYYAWEGITRCHRGNAQVNLFLNRVAPWLDVDSFLPYEGKVVLRNKTATRISVRIPAWVDRDQLRLTVNGKSRELVWVGAHVVVDALKPADALELCFPVAEQTVTYSICDGTRYTIHTRGNTVVDISPRDERPTSYPFYLRDNLKTGRKAPLKEITRFISDRVIAW